MASGTCRSVRGCWRRLASIALILVFAFSLTLWTSVWQARARDARFALRYVVSFWLYLHAGHLSDVSGAAEHSVADVPESAHGADRDVPMGNAADAEHSWLWFGYSVGGDRSRRLLAVSGISPHPRATTMDKI